MTYKKIAGLIPTIQAVKLVEHNLDFSKKKKSSKNLIKNATGTIVGLGLIGATASIIDDL